jgi:hypothetical protein
MRVETLVSLSCKAYVIDSNSNWNVAASLVMVPNVFLHEYVLNDSWSSDRQARQDELTEMKPIGAFLHQFFGEESGIRITYIYH